MLRPTPAVSAESGPFWEGARCGNLRLQRCGDCGRIPYPPLPRCPDCLSDALDWTTLSGRARLRGWTDNHLVAFGERPRPTCMVECALEEDPRAVLVVLDETASVRGAEPDAPLRITFAQDANGWFYPQASLLRDAGP